MRKRIKNIKPGIKFVCDALGNGKTEYFLKLDITYHPRDDRKMWVNGELIKRNAVSLKTGLLWMFADHELVKVVK